ncbi:MAG TPA: hypothetical protein VMA53_28750 [Stellaceae bacterium]|nr:hypothetical protein [Stellaceae bacterium]
MTVIWTPGQAFFLAGIGMVIGFLLGSEMLEAWRSRQRRLMVQKIATAPRQAVPPLPLTSEPETAVALRRMGVD